MPNQNSKVVYAGRLIDGVTDRVQTNMSVIIEGGRIREVRSGKAASAYGAASSLITLLLWIYYSSQILLFGAEFTQVYAARAGRALVPDEYAVRV